MADHVDRELGDYECLHEAAGCPKLSRVEASGPYKCGFTRRIALSCLVDADHGDTARHYGNEVETPKVEPRWQDRLAALQRYVDSLPEGKTEREQARNRLRKRMFEVCRDAPLDPPIRTCDAPVGSGKTTAVLRKSNRDGRIVSRLYSVTWTVYRREKRSESRHATVCENGCLRSAVTLHSILRFVRATRLWAAARRQQ